MIASQFTNLLMKILASLLLAVVTFIAQLEQERPGPMLSPTAVTSPTPTQKQEVLGTQTDLNTVSRVIDGDTIEILSNGQKMKVRLIGVDSPESVDPRQEVQCFGKEASQFLKNLLQGKQVRLEADASQQDRDRYARLLRYAYLEDGKLVNQLLIEEGMAYEYTYSNAYKYQREFKDAQMRAEVQKKGLWKPGVCDRR